MEGSDITKNYILSIDQGTSGTKAVLFDTGGCLIGRHNEAHRQIYPRSGWVEHDAKEIYEKTLCAVRGVLDDFSIRPDDIVAISISNQRETAVVWDRQTGQPVYNAIVWQCGRAKQICRDIMDKGGAEIVKQKTGLVLSPYFTAAKIAWILDNVEGVREKAMQGRLMCGTIDSWLLYKLTGGHMTDYSNACRTQLFNINTLSWDDELLDMFRIPRSMMPQVLPSDTIFGKTDCNGIFKTPVQVTGVLGDSHAALFGQTCFESGMVKATMGTGSSIMMNIGKKPIFSDSGLVTSIAWRIGDETDYVFEGNINYAGATIKWLADGLELIQSSKEAGVIAASVEDTKGVYIVPAFSGLGPPYWNSEAKAIICGLTGASKKAHIVRAAEESIAYQIRDILAVMQKEGSKLRELRVDGGPTRDNFLMQFMADILDVTVVRNQIEELSAIGAAYMAGLAVGIWHSKDELSKLRTVERSFESRMNDERRHILCSGWNNAVARTVYQPQAHV